MAHFEALQELSLGLWQKRRLELGAATEEAESLLEQLQGEEQVYLRYILGTLPPSDLAEYGAAFFLNILRQALAARRDFSWCGDLSERQFLLQVAYPRIHDEALSDCRELFRRALEPRVRGLSLREAILEVNRWCAEQVTYRPTDDRTGSALEVYRRGFGRCGEESVFAVMALRSVGIAARQVYCPWWSHCDDNHAWVECWDGSDWRYLGACEPEPVLDRGWFPPAAGRAMLIHTRVFLPEMETVLFPGTPEEALYAAHGMVYEVITDRYAETRTVTVSAANPAGRPVSGVQVIFSVLNMGAFLPIAQKQTDGSGTVSLRLGMGSVKIVCLSEKGERGEALLDTARETAVTVTLGSGIPREQDFNFTVPEGSGRFQAPLSPKERQLRSLWLEQAAVSRAARQIQPLPAPHGRQALILAALTEKDRAGFVEPAILEDGEEAFAFEKGLPQSVFEEAMLSQRIGKEPLTPWRGSIRAMLGDDLLECFADEPEALWDWLTREVRPMDSHPTLTASPMATRNLRAGNTASLRVLFCAVCRCAGVPARISPIDGAAEYWRDGAYHCPETKETYATMRIKGEGKPVTVSRLGAGEWPLITAEEAEITLTPGTYRLISATRLPSGTQLARHRILTLKAGEQYGVQIAARTANVQELTTRYPLPEFQLRDGSGDPVNSGELLREKSLVCWLEPGREPTEHLLRELAEAGEKIACPVHFVLPEIRETADPALCEALSKLPRTQVWQGDFRETAEALARSVFTEPGRLPLLLLCDGAGICRYGRTGYNVGTASLLGDILEALGEEY